MIPRLTMSLKPIRDYKSAIETLNSLQGWGRASGGTQKLTEMVKYLNRCGISLDALDNLPVIHVTGTHGKGSTCAYCESILNNGGYKTGFYSSPHLLQVRERIRIGGKPISKSDFSRYFWEVYDMLDDQKEGAYDMPLYFKFLTVLAFYIFLKEKMDVAIIEVGIGGEFDCTNVLRQTTVSGIAAISLDHTALLGETVESVAWHKSGIMKDGGLAISVDQPASILNVLLERSKEKKCTLRVLKNSLYVDEASKIPVHVQKTNASLAIALSQAFVEKRGEPGRISLDFAIRCVENTQWPGRYQVKQVDNIRFFLDSAHTRGSIRTTSGWFREETKDSDRKKVLIFNLTGKRDAEMFLRELISCAFDVGIFIPNVGFQKETTDTTNYKLPVDTQLDLCEDYRDKWLGLEGNEGGTGVVLPSFAQAVKFLDGLEQYDALVTGSLYLVGAALSVLDPTLNGMLSD